MARIKTTWETGTMTVGPVDKELRRWIARYCRKTKKYLHEIVDEALRDFRMKSDPASVTGKAA